MTKLHEQMIRGAVGDIAAHPDIMHPQGEFTVVLRPAGETAGDSVSDEDVWREFGVLTKESGLNRRQAISLAARRLGMPTRDAYAALERHKVVLQTADAT
jgi:16S rRNA C1402 (ribose-2'-O) methylase RsmI